MKITVDTNNYQIEKGFIEKLKQVVLNEKMEMNEVGTYEFTIEFKGLNYFIETQDKEHYEIVGIH